MMPDVLAVLTLKQMKKEKGMVTRTRSQQRIVRIHPHTPIPVSLSSAALRKEREKYTMKLGWMTMEGLDDHHHIERRTERGNEEKLWFWFAVPTLRRRR